MNQKALRTLEYNKITEMLAARAASPMGKHLAAALEPMHYIGDIQRALAETTAAVGHILRKGSLPMGGISDIRTALQRAEAGGILSAEEILQVGECLYVFGKVVAYGGQNDAENALDPYFGGITLHASLEKEIARCIKPSGDIADNASPKLSELRRNIGQAHSRVREHLQGIIHSASYKNMLQDAIVTLRGDRFCVPVKAEYRGSFPGMVHDQSSSGATVFMEPLSVVDLNNKIKDLHYEEKREEERILLALSGKIAEAVLPMEASLQQVAHLDFAFAKGELSLAMEASCPVFNSRGYVNIIKAKHPLLNQATVVPTSIYLGGEFNMLLITGPNTGGKTVSLKTVGLLTCMGQAGLHIPAADSSELAVFDDVFADIGDEQSIEQSLSTFSSHMTNIVGILQNLSPNTLVLLDELGAGTDPTEGAALAVAILEHLRERQVRTVVTTHYSELKMYALATPAAQNASCEFDVETLRPTYRLLIGIPGKSNAFAIAGRLSLGSDIIDNARGILTQKDIRFEDVITDLEASKKEVLLEQERAEIYRREAENLQAEAAKLEERLRTQREKLQSQARAEAQTLVANAKKEAEALISDMRKQLSGTAQRELEESRRKVREGLTSLEASLQADTEKPTRKPPENLRRGEKVHIHSLNQEGTISTLPDANGIVQIQAGIMKIKVNITDITRINEEPQKTWQTTKTKHQSSGIKSQSISTELDLRGLMPEEATAAVEKYLDDVILSSLATVTIIHGKGTGVLRKAVHATLKRYPQIKEYRLGRFGEGEDGVTVVTF
ncbi:MAG: endonuclease MutS2 [Defluviitaleaceae bacterium]|nr:endonuclease MutS2 [Defluviitaleaceae bacterium]